MVLRKLPAKQVAAIAQREVIAKRQDLLLQRDYAGLGTTARGEAVRRSLFRGNVLRVITARLVLRRRFRVQAGRTRKRGVSLCVMSAPRGNSVQMGSQQRVVPEATTVWLELVWTHWGVQKVRMVGLKGFGPRRSARHAMGASSATEQDLWSLRATVAVDTTVHRVATGRVR